jgi:glycosyltransferase involved in cell wall biosynthesis
MAAYTNYRRDPRVRREAEALVEAGHEIVFLSRRQPGEARHDLVCGVRLLTLPGLKHGRDSFAGYLADYLLFFVLLSCHLMRHPLRYRLIHINNMPDFLVFATWLPRLLRIPVIHDVHDLMPEIYLEKFPSPRMRWVIACLKLQERWAAAFATAVLTVEERLKDILSQRGVARDKIHVLMNLPDERIFSTCVRRLEKAPDKPFVMVYHGTLAHRLGLDLAIEALALCRDGAVRMELHVIGDGEERSRLIALRDRLGLQDLVRFSDGFVPVQEIPALIADADAGLVPLRASSATDIMLPTKLLEYVLSGIPCIVPRTVTIGRYFDDQMVQFFEAGSVPSLAEAMLALYHDPQRRARLAQQATAGFGASHTWQRHKRVYLDLVERLIAS